MRRTLLAAGLVALEFAALGASSPRPPHPKLPADADIDARWIYDDVPGAMAKARETGRPLLLVFR